MNSSLTKPTIVFLAAAAALVVAKQVVADEATFLRLSPLQVAAVLALLALLLGAPSIARRIEEYR